MNRFKFRILCLLTLGALTACDRESAMPAPSDEAMDGSAQAERRGAHNGRLFRDGAFELELAIFETGVPPEFRAWATEDGEPLDPDAIELEVRLTRLGGRIDEIRFRKQDDYLRGDTVIYEPHSFVVTIGANHAGRAHRWEYDSFEGRTRIGEEMAQSFGLETELAGPAVIDEIVDVYGTIVPNADRVRAVSARFDGVVESIDVAIGDRVGRGQTLARVESNESLQVYTIAAPIDGIVVERRANAGEQTAGRQLFTIVDTSSVWAELSIFPAERSRVRLGAKVFVSPATEDGEAAEGSISYLGVQAGANQAVTARVELDNSDGVWPLGAFVSAQIVIGRHEVPLAVKRGGLQSFRDFTVVYAKIGDEYEVRMLDLGRQSGDWAEVLGGLEPGTRYVTENSYVLKADVEKSGAAHDH